MRAYLSLIFYYLIMQAAGPLEAFTTTMFCRCLVAVIRPSPFAAFHIHSTAPRDVSAKEALCSWSTEQAFGDWERKKTGQAFLGMDTVSSA